MKTEEEIKQEMQVDYPVFTMSEIETEARLLARAWGDEYIPGIGLNEKVKLASDFMNYARRIRDREGEIPLLTMEDDYYVEYHITSCCKIGPITSENYCSNCGKKIVKP